MMNWLRRWWHRVFIDPLARALAREILAAPVHMPPPEVLRASAAPPLITAVAPEPEEPEPSIAEGRFRVEWEDEQHGNVVVPTDMEWRAAEAFRDACASPTTLSAVYRRAKVSGGVVRWQQLGRYERGAT